MDDYDIPTCDVCGCDLEWTECWNCCDGYFDGYEDDPMWYDPGDLIPCSECHGRGGYLVCPMAEFHTHQPSPVRLSAPPDAGPTLIPELRGLVGNGGAGPGGGQKE